MPSRLCTVSFTDISGVTHSVEMSATSLYEAAVLGLAECRHCEFAEVIAGSVSRLTVTVKATATTHELSVAKLEKRLTGGAKSP
jgi:hypothetical protein